MFGSDVMAAGVGYEGTKLTNAANARQAEMQMQFQERMSSTAHQREASDLRAAGLNRILSVSKGGPGASTPPGAMARMENPFAAGLAGLASGSAYRQSQADIANTKENTKKLEQETKTGAAQEGESQDRATLLRQQRETEFHRTYETMMNSARSYFDADSAESLRNINRARETKELLDGRIYGGTEGEVLRRAELYGSAASDIGHAVGSIMRFGGNRYTPQWPPGRGRETPLGPPLSHPAPAGSARQQQRMDIVDPKTGEILRSRKYGPKGPHTP